MPLPHGYVEVRSGLGAASPRELLLVPTVANGAANGVLELGFLSPPDPVAVVLDMGLPDQSGLTVLELLKGDPSTRHVPIHVVSVHDYQRVALALGAVGYALKPVKREQLLAAFRLIEDRLARRVKQETLATARDHHVEYRIVRPDGQVRWVAGHGKVVVDAEGRRIGMVGVCMDVTERKAALRPGP